MMKRNWKRYGALLALAGLIVLTQSSLVAGQPERPVTMKYDYQQAIFERDGHIYLYNELNKSVKELGDPNSLKYMPFASSDLLRVAFGYTDYASEEGGLKLGVYYRLDDKTVDITIPTAYSNAILALDWIDENTLGVEGHVNPSTSEYFVVDIPTGTVTKSYAGALFTALPGGSIFYRGHIPYGQELEVKDSYYVDDTLVYVSDEPETTLSYPQFSKDLTKVAFVEKSDIGPSKLVYGSWNVAAKQLAAVTKTPIADGVGGTLQFVDNEQVPSIVQETGVMTLNPSTQSLAPHMSVQQQQTGEILKLETEYKLEALNKSLKAEFGDSMDKEFANIQSLQWFK
ncbi:hypothetical protein [Gorillibacterium sp. CAU 1737]|uniref:hypothetical protein n=1 Tax=Gorillibacterium sp. CAU 1737 TaxID=3140362 RepID=UPI00326127CC